MPSKSLLGDLAVGRCRSRSVSGAPSSDGLRLGELLRPAADLDRLAQRFHPDPRRLAAGLRLDLLEPGGDRVERGDAAVVALVGLLQAAR